MPRVPETPTATDLSRAYPDSQLEMQSVELEYEARSHGLRYSVRQGKKTAQIKIWLTSGHHMMLRPVDRGSGGCARWISPIITSEDSDDTIFVLRAWVEIVNRRSGNRNKEKQSESFTVQGDSLKSVVKNVLQAYALQTGKVLMPEFVGDEE